MENNKDSLMEVFIDESGQLGIKDRYIIFCCLILDDINLRKWKRLRKSCIKEFNKNRPKILDEIKAHYLTYKEKKYLINRISEKINYRIFIGIIDKKSSKFINKFCQKQSPSKELSVNYILGRIFCEKIAIQFEQLNWTISMDSRNIGIKNRKSLEDYINTKLINERNTVIKVNYIDSKNCIGIQLSDLLANIIFTKNNFNKCIKLYKKIENNIDTTFKYPNI